MAHSPEDRRAYMKRYRKTDLYKRSQSVRRRRYLRKLRRDVIAAYGNGCKRCGFDDIRALTIDHIKQDGHKHRDTRGRKLTAWPLYQWLKRNKFPKRNFRCLCANCQMIVWRERV